MRRIPQEDVESAMDFGRGQSQPRSIRARDRRSSTKQSPLSANRHPYPWILPDNGLFSQIHNRQGSGASHILRLLDFLHIIP